MSRDVGTGGQGDSIVPSPKDSEDQLTLFQLRGGGGQTIVTIFYHFTQTPSPWIFRPSYSPDQGIQGTLVALGGKDVQFPSLFCKNQIFRKLHC